MWQTSGGSSSPVDFPRAAETSLICAVCKQQFREPKVLTCFHTFCKECLEAQLDAGDSDKIVCSLCGTKTQLSSQLGLRSLLDDYGIASLLLQQSASEDKSSAAGLELSISLLPSPDSNDSASGDKHSGEVVDRVCSSCTMNERASFFCRNCDQFICEICAKAHYTMRCFEGHRVEALSASGVTSGPNCVVHPGEAVTVYCVTCGVAICDSCKTIEHGEHSCELIAEVADRELKLVEELLHKAILKKNKLQDMSKSNELAQNRLRFSLSSAFSSLDATARVLYRMIAECHKLAKVEVDAAYGKQKNKLADVQKKVQTVIEKLQLTVQFTERLLKNAAPTEVLVFKKLLTARLEMLLAINPDPRELLASCAEIAHPALDEQCALLHIRSLMGLSDTAGATNGELGVVLGVSAPSPGVGTGIAQLGRLQKAVTAPLLGAYSPNNGCHFASSRSLDPLSDGDAFDAERYEKWSTEQTDLNTLRVSELSECETPAESEAVMAVPVMRPHIRRHKVMYHAMFGDFGVLAWQFTEPSGVAVTALNDFAVVDTSNHRVSVFSVDGHFKFHFGDHGKGGGQLLYPNRIAVSLLTGEFAVTERAPAHQVQTFSHNGKFLRKFGGNVLRHPRGVCVDSADQIIVIECKVMRVVIFDRCGEALRMLDCTQFLEFPNAIATNNHGELFVSDNRSHCVKVFDYEGRYLRQIGGEGLTNFPIGVGINDAGEVVVTDNHNSFNVTIFDQEGTLLSAFEGRVKHAQCFDMALLHGIRSLILASKDFRIFVYRYDVYAVL